ncbi:hypothetical protein STRTUCAR8_08552 [Streptomyces turgidiscabies Car8]|uniref:Uncharacterized protein n=1 Tax=Streptomyces turgidiscabies (strain Car8) TaxID=698760 RepID=L7F7T1_STRT8|nr:hypothetical protein [Streptomyces turgidiscabies]ELP67643.1 hypothetical protein STRTUCAR8_08552 [Streptomyces turgidiscabies Car8]
MPLIRKEHAGNDSFGNSWPEDGAVVEVAPDHAQALLAIGDGGFSEVAPPAAEDPDPDTPPATPEAPEGEKEIFEVDPEAPEGEPAAKSPAKKTAARKTAASKPVEE